MQTTGGPSAMGHTEYAHGVPQSATPAEGAWRSETSVLSVR
ncbi:hypothetical protein [Natronomonas sp. LN261]|jgi:hypothetical protein|nr:hypothetical protein [Natronomonas sp. LN261]